MAESSEPLSSLFRIRLVPTANVFKRGHRLLLDISSSNFPRFDRNLSSGGPLATGTRIVVAQQTVLHTSEYPSTSYPRSSWIEHV